MDNKLLTVLGCSGSIALSMLGADAVNAKEYIFTAPEASSPTAQIPESKTDYPFIDCSCQEYDAETAAKLDKEGDKAIQLYGCDCAGCRNMVKNIESPNAMESQKI